VLLVCTVYFILFVCTGPPSLADLGFKHPNAKFILNCVPQVIPFSHRIAIFQHLINNDKRGLVDTMPFHSHESDISLKIRRDFIIEDTYQGSDFD